MFSHIDVASAQEDAEETVIVTARRREESFQDVPVAMTAFDADSISTAGIERTQDFINLTPNVTLVQTQNQGTSFLTIRGVSQARNSEPSAAIIVDGVLLTNPAQLNQELFDIQSIEVLKGPQGAIFGRNAVGGAILITTEQPGDEHEGRVKLGYDSGSGVRAQISSGGPFGDSDTLKYQAALSYFDTDGYIDNVHLGEEADPFQDTSIRLRLIGEPSDRLRWDARVYNSAVETQALYYRIGEDDDVNNTSYRVRVNNPGMNDRDLTQVSFKLDFDADYGTFTSITSFDTIEEILTGDQYDFLPEEESIFYFLGTIDIPGFGLYDWAQSQYLDVETISQEIRFTSPAENRFRWIAGAYAVQTDRYISTSNIQDPLGGGDEAFPVYRTPLSNQISFLADGQDNLAWAVFGEVATDLSDRTELSVALRYDEDTRENTTLTPQEFLALIPSAMTGEVRKQTWDELQPRITLRYQPSSSLTLYGAWSRGFRSGGFNQTGVGAEQQAIDEGVRDLFDAEVADTLEFGIKSQLADNRVQLNLSVYDTTTEGSYFFLFIPANGTQNLGSIEEVSYQGFEIDLTARLTDYLNLSASYGYTDSEITEYLARPEYEGNQAPLVTEDTFNVGMQYRRPIGSSGLGIILRGDYQRVGDTWWDPANTTVRRPVNLLDIRVGVEGDSWSATAWQKNLNDVAWNTEWSPGPLGGVGGFLWPAAPRIWGFDFVKYF